MAIVKRKRKKGFVFQVKVRGSDRMWITKTFGSEREARIFENKMSTAVLYGQQVFQSDQRCTLNDFWEIWSDDSRGDVTDGWRQSQTQMYEQYVRATIGFKKLQLINAADIKRTLQNVKSLGRSPQTCRHVFNLLHKIFKDAMEDYELVQTSPVRSKFKPEIPQKESRHLRMEEVKKLLSFVRGKPYEVAIWFGVYVGLRIGEIQSLTWDCVDLNAGVVHVRSTYARKKKIIRDYPKGRKWHSPPLPQELIEMLTFANENRGKFVCPSPESEMLLYDGYLKVLKRYCREAGVPVVSTHGLRHSTAGVYLAHRATKDDLRELFAHSSNKVTDRYIHGKSKRLEKVASVIRLVPTGSGDA